MMQSVNMFFILLSMPLPCPFAKQRILLINDLICLKGLHKTTRKISGGRPQKQPAKCRTQNVTHSLPKAVFKYFPT